MIQHCKPLVKSKRYKLKPIKCEASDFKRDITVPVSMKLSKVWNLFAVRNVEFESM